MSRAEYQYDVFVSYRRKTAVERWVSEVLVPTIDRWAPESGIPKDRVYVDFRMQRGGVLRDRVETALLSSATMLAVCSPSYFYDSDWCWQEWQTMRSRELACGLHDGHLGPGLIYPLVFKGPTAACPYPPSEQGAVRDERFIPYNKLKGTHVREPTETYCSFENELERVLDELSGWLMSVPPRDDAWVFDTSSHPEWPNPPRIRRPTTYSAMRTP